MKNVKNSRLIPGQIESGNSFNDFKNDAITTANMDFIIGGRTTFAYKPDLTIIIIVTPYPPPVKTSVKH